MSWFAGFGDSGRGGMGFLQKFYQKKRRLRGLFRMRFPILRCKE